MSVANVDLPEEGGVAVQVAQHVPKVAAVFAKAEEVMYKAEGASFDPVDETFPYPCPAGFLGGNDSAAQESAKCAGPCPSGYYCPTEATVTPAICPAGAPVSLGSAHCAWLELSRISVSQAPTVRAAHRRPARALPEHLEHAKGSRPLRTAPHVPQAPAALRGRSFRLIAQPVQLRHPLG